MRKEQLIAKGLSDEHAQIAVDFCKEAFRGFVPKTRFDAVNEKLRAANAVIASYPDKDRACQKAVDNGQIKIALQSGRIEITLKEGSS